MTAAKFPVEQVSAPVHCEFSEKAIMLCKAVAMGDAKSYERFARAENPAKVRVQIIRHAARTPSVGKYQPCMF